MLLFSKGSVRILVVCVCLFSSVGFVAEVFAQEPAAEKKETPAVSKDDAAEGESKNLETLEGIKKDFSRRMRAYSKKYRAAPTKAEKAKVAKEEMPSATKYHEKLTELINKAPDSDGAKKAIAWWYRIARNRGGGKIVVDLVLKHYAKSKAMSGYVPWLPRHLSADEARRQLTSLIEMNPESTVKASATFQLHELLTQQVAGLTGEKKEAMEAEIKSLKDSLMTKYVDAAMPRGAKYSGILAAREFATKLEIGKPVPDIVGADLDGEEFKLSDYRGKVTMISFWGNW